MRKPVQKICENCKQEFTFNSGSKREYSVRRFCTAKCLGAYFAPQYTISRKGAGNPMYGKTPWNYKGGSKKIFKYKKIWKDGKVVREHRVIMEEYLQRRLSPNEVVHHIDGNHKNNKLSNLMICNSHAEHRALHSRGGVV